MTPNERIAYKAGYMAASYPVEQAPYRDAKLQAAYEKGKADREKYDPANLRLVPIKERSNA